MTKEQINAVLESVRSWPEQDQEELVELAREIEARRSGVYVMSDEERAAVQEGSDQARRGEFVPDDEMAAFWKKYGVLLEFGTRRVRVAILSRSINILRSEVPAVPAMCCERSTQVSNSSQNIRKHRTERTIRECA